MSENRQASFYWVAAMGTRAFRMLCLPFLLLPLGIASCRSSADSSPAVAGDGPIRVFVSILPQAYFVERVGGGRVEVEVLVGPGQSPHAFEPAPQQMAKLAKAKMYFRIGLPFEARFLEKLGSTFKNVEVVDTREGVELLSMTEAHEHDGHEHEAGEPDPHIWMDPRLVKIQAANIADALIRADPSHRDQYEANLSAFQADLDAVYTKMAELLAPMRGEQFLAYHPAFGYFAQAFGLEQVTVEREGKEPSPKQLAALIKQAAERNVKVIFVQPQFSTKSAEAIAQQIHGVVVPVDPLERDYLVNLMHVAESVRKGLAESDAGAASGPSTALGTDH